MSFYKSIYLFLLVILFSSCSKTDSVKPELIVGKEELIFGKDSETQKLGIKSNLKWNISSSESWCTVSPASGETGTSTVEVSVNGNTATIQREATLTVSVQNLSKQVKIKQAGIPFLITGTKELNVKTEGGTISITIESPVQYSVSVSNNWITESTVSGTKRDFIIAANPGIMTRKGTVIFSSGSYSETVNIYQSGAHFEIPADKTGVENDAMALAAKMKVGWNVGNSLEACNGTTSASETMWGNPPISKSLINAVKAAGFNAIRIPCAWSGYIEDQETHRIKNSWLARVKEVVDYCVDNDMYAILNIHWDGGWLEENPTYAKQEAVNKKQKALWEQIAIYFRNYDEHLLFAGTNEVHANYGNPTTEHVTVQMSFNQTFVDAVRSTGGRNVWRNLVIQAYNTNIDQAVQHLKMPTDKVSNRLMAEVHYYDPWDFCGDMNSGKYLWGNEFAGKTGVSTWGQESHADTQFGKMKTNFIDKDIPVILGEYSATYRATLTGQSLTDHIKSRNNFLFYVTKSAVERGLIPFYWDNGATGNDGSGLFNRSTGAHEHPEAIQSIINGASQ